MFQSREDAVDFAFDLAHQLDEVETDGWHISPTLDGAEIRLGAGVARVRGRLDGGGYRVRELDVDPEEDGNWPVAKLDVRPE